MNIEEKRNVRAAIRAAFADAEMLVERALMAGVFDFDNEDAFREEIEWHVSHVEALMGEFDCQKFRQGTRDGIQTKERSVEYLRREGYTEATK